MKQILKILKIIGSWIIGFFAIIFGLFSIFTMPFWLTKVFAGLLIIIGLYIIPIVNKKLNFGIKPLFLSILLLISFFGIPISDINKPDKFAESQEIETEEYYITANVLNVREGQGTNYKVLFKLKKGDKIEVISEENNWSKISIPDGQAGYVSSEFISSKPPDNKDDENWLTYIIIGIVVVIGMFSKGENSSSSTMSSPSKNVVPQKREIEKEKAIKPIFICKYCGYESSNLSHLTAVSCQRSPTGKHQPFEGGKQQKYICKHCGYESSNLSHLTAVSCQRSSTGKHQPLESGIQSEYVCKHCGYKSSNLSHLTAVSCQRSSTGKHQPL